MHGGKPIAGPGTVFLRKGGLDFTDDAAVLFGRCAECSCAAQKADETAFADLFNPHAHGIGAGPRSAGGGPSALAFDQGADGDETLARPRPSFSDKGGSETSSSVIGKDGGVLLVTD